MQCNICEQATRQAFSHKILGKYDCAYFYCDACGFLQTEKPYWLDEAYSSAIAEADTGLVQRNINLSKALATSLFFLFERNGKYLDAAGGYGLLTRLMRDTGFDFYWSDKHCKNLLARGFDENASMAFTAVTAFEVMEHLHDPLTFITETMSNAKSGTIIFSTELFSDEPPRPGAWWYYTFETGQHISFYQERTLRAIGNRLGLNFYSSNGIHMLTDRKINRLAYRLLTSRKISNLLNWIPQQFMVSRTMADHLFIISKNQQLSDRQTHIKLGTHPGTHHD